MQRAAIGVLVSLGLVGLLSAGCKRAEVSQQAEPAAAAPEAAESAKVAQPPKATEPPKAAEPVKYDSPQAVFNAAKAAAEARDFGTLADCIDPEARGELAAGMVVMLGFITMMDKTAQPEVEALSKKHELPDAKAMGKMKGSQKERMAVLAKSIKHPKALIVDAMRLLEQSMDRQAKKRKSKATRQRMIDGELTDVKIEGNKATAKMKRKKGKAEPIEFVRIDGSWFLEIRLR